MSEKKLIVRQVKSAIGRDKKVRKKLAALGLGRIGKEREFASTPAILGMIKDLEHLLAVREA